MVQAMKTLRFVVFIFILAILSGCASTGQIVKNYNSPYETKKEINLLLEPMDTTGILETPALREGKVSFYEFVFPEILFAGEIYPWRIKWFGLAVVGDKEYLAQLIYLHKASLTGKLIGGLMIDGTAEEHSGGKVLGFSTRMAYAYGLDVAETEIHALEWREDLLSHSKKRQEMVEKHGIEIKRLPKADYLREIIGNWNRYETDRGAILSPLTEEQFKKTAALNPAYSYSQKYAKNMKGNLAPDPIAIGVSAFFDLVSAAGADAEGWDFGSKENKRQAALRSKHLFNIKQNVIDELNKKLKKNTEGEKK